MKAPIHTAPGVALIIGLGLTAFVSVSAQAGNAVNTGYFGGIAVAGYDVVAYFTQSQAVKGSEDHQHEFLGETWHFSSDEHRDLFAKNPIAYAPQYGGFCAAEMLYADVTTGVTSNIDPEAWRIIDGKLFLFYDKGYAAVFEENANAMIEKADGHWKDVKQRLEKP